MTDQRKDPPSSAVALRYTGSGAPRLTAKGRGFVAEEILARAKAHNIPLHEDPALVQLLACVELGDEIPESLYLAVAKLLAFIYSLKHREPPLR